MDNATKRALLVGVYDELMDTFRPGSPRNVMQSKLSYEQELYVKNMEIDLKKIITNPDRLTRVIEYFSETEEYEACTDLSIIKDAIKDAV